MAFVLKCFDTFALDRWIASHFISRTIPTYPTLASWSAIYPIPSPLTTSHLSDIPITSVPAPLLIPSARLGEHPPGYTVITLKLLTYSPLSVCLCLQTPTTAVSRSSFARLMRLPMVM